MAVRDKRQVRFWELQDLAEGHGLEIGPLYRPTVRPGEARISYVDVYSTEQLRERYAKDPAVTVETIPDIDFSLLGDDGHVRTLPEAVGSRAPYDWVIASHVIEHVPNLIAWLGQVAEVIADDGALLLAVPDRRYSFDLHRPLTTVGQMIQAYEAGDSRPSIRATYDHFRSHVTVNTVRLWSGQAPPGFDGRSYPLPAVHERLTRSRAGEYVDSHVWIFTPQTFLTQMAELRLLGLSSWYVESITETPTNELEFMVRMRRLPRGVDPSTAEPAEVVPTASAPDWLLAESAARTRITELEQQVDKLRAKVREQRRRIGRMESSRRWRLGKAVLAPARAVKRLGRRLNPSQDHD